MLLTVHEFTLLVDAIIPNCCDVEKELLIKWLITNKDRIPDKEKSYE